MADAKYTPAAVYTAAAMYTGAAVYTAAAMYTGTAVYSRVPIQVDRRMLPDTPPGYPRIFSARASERVGASKPRASVR